MIFELKGEEYIELIKLLKLLGLAESGGDAKQYVDDGDIMVNNETEYRRRKKLRTGDVVDFLNQKIEIK
jgi:ribosome-associated protein